MRGPQRSSAVLPDSKAWKSRSSAFSDFRISFSTAAAVPAGAAGQPRIGPETPPPLQDLLVLVGAEQRLQHRLVETTRIDPLGGSGAGPVPLAGVAVGVDLALGGGAQVVVAAGPTDNQAPRS